MLLHKLHMFKSYKTEIFFIACLISSVLTAGYFYAQIAAAIIIPAFFLSRRAFVMISTIIIFMMIFISFTVLVVDEKSVRKETISYETTRGTVVVPIETPLKAGEAVIGLFVKENFQGREGRFARGYLRLDKIYYRTELPLVSWILEKRSQTSEDLFINSAGRLTIIQALLMGNVSYLEKPIQDVYLQTGLTHLLSVSGSHVGVVTLICFTTLFFLPLKMRMIFACVALLAFIPLAGFKVPVMRSALSAIVVMIAWLLDNKTDLRKFVLFLWGVFLLISPTLLGNISFLLSFTAIYGIASLNYSNMGWWEGSIKVGIVATAFTMPLSMYVFGTFSIASIFTTMIMVPVVYFQLIAGFFYMLFPPLFLEPLVMLEQLNVFTAEKLAEYMGMFFTFKYINVYVFAALMLYLFAVSFTRHVMLSSLVFLAVFLPSYMPDGLYFPELNNFRAFIYKKDGRTEAFFSGMHSSYMYGFLPFVAKFGTTSFDYADIHIYDGKNSILKSLEENGSFSEICVNDPDCTKPLIYMTRSNTIRKKNIKADKTYFLLKNNLKADNIIELFERTPLVYDLEKKEIR